MKSHSATGAIIALIFLAWNTEATTHYVDLNSTNSVTPYASWSVAATNIQDAVDAAASGDLVLVTNGIYATGGRSWFSQGTNRVTLTNNITLQSVNGPSVTWIVGKQVPGTGNVLSNAVRCVGIGNNAILSGFTLTNGEAGNGNYPTGGGVACIAGPLFSGIVTNCIIVNNLATNSAGGGAYRVTLINCLLKGNSAEYGGGACDSALINCEVVSNNAVIGGGVYTGSGFGTSTLSNCTVVGNSATSSSGGFGNANGYVYNSIMYYNVAPTGSNYLGIKMNNCCTAPGFLGQPDDFTNEPQFQNLAGGDFHLQPNSPCINAGNNRFMTVTNDLDGNPRIVGGTVDIGAHEYQTPASVLSYAWAQEYGLPTDGSADYLDSDGDGMNNWQEWHAGTDPTNPSSVLKMMPVANASTGLQVVWQSVSGKDYWIERSTNLSVHPAFSTIQTNYFVNTTVATFNDKTATNGGPYFYRVGVQQ